MIWEEEYYQALHKCGERYRKMMIVDVSDLKYWGRNVEDPMDSNILDLQKFINEYIIGCENKLPLMKLNRWLGYIQGILIQWNVTTVDEERNWTRPLFKHLDYAGMVESVDSVCSKHIAEMRGGSSPSTRTKQ